MARVIISAMNGIAVRFLELTMKYDIQNNDIFIAADGGLYGHLVTDVQTYAHVDDVVTTPFTASGLDHSKAGNRIDAFKLAQVRYYKPDDPPDWVPDLRT